MVLNIADIKINFKGVNEYFVKRSKIFLQPENMHDTCDMDLEIDYSEKISMAEGEVIVNDEPVWIRRDADKGYGIYLSNRNTGAYNLSVEASWDWDNVRITALKAEGKRLFEFQTFLFAGVAFRNRLIKKNGLQIHSSAIDYMGDGIIFSAASGTGKSTHTSMWKELYGDDVTIVNDDRPAVRIINGQVMLCGTPWSGTSSLFTNSIVPLKGIVMLEQSPVNEIAGLSKDRAIQLLMPRCFLPYYDQGMMKEAIDILEKILDNVPIYLLKCRPDHEAVELVRKCMN